MGKRLGHILLVGMMVLWASCCKVPTSFVQDEVAPDIFPDYSEVTIPQNIAPLRFRLNLAAKGNGAVARLSNATTSLVLSGPEFKIPLEAWRELTAGEGEILVETFEKKDGWHAYKPFKIYVNSDQMDSHLVYRLIEPGYETWNQMGIYQRELSTFAQKTIITNDKTDKNCMNCHSFCDRNPDKMMFHMRAKNGGTYIWNQGKLEKLNTKTPETLSALVYPGWHPSGRIIAYSVNDIAQAFHSTNKNRIEVYDSASDVVVYDIDKHMIVSTPELMKPDELETFPAFSPDGRKLIFCSSPRQKVPDDYAQIRYSICSIDFNTEDMSFGSTVDTLYSAHKTGRCAIYPRISPDGKFLMYTETDYGCFSIWHKDADLRLMDLTTGEVMDLANVNSDDVDSYHSWSSNGRWVVFSSRRVDGLYTRPYIFHIDEDGSTTKPFVLPQEGSRFYDNSLKSFNIPEYVAGEVSLDQDLVVRTAKEDKGTDVSFAPSN